MNRSYKQYDINPNQPRGVYSELRPIGRDSGIQIVPQKNENEFEVRICHYDAAHSCAPSDWISEYAETMNVSVELHSLDLIKQALEGSSQLPPDMLAVTSVTLEAISHMLVMRARPEDLEEESVRIN